MSEPISTCSIRTFNLYEGRYFHNGTVYNYPSVSELMWHDCFGNIHRTRFACWDDADDLLNQCVHVIFGDDLDRWCRVELVDDDSCDVVAHVGDVPSAYVIHENLFDAVSSLSELMGEYPEYGTNPRLDNEFDEIKAACDLVSDLYLKLSKKYDY